MSDQINVTLRCDWRAFGTTCGTEELFTGRGWREDARESEWGWIDWAGNRSHAPARWYCPTHSRLFRQNGGWGGLPSGEPPARRRNGRSPLWLTILVYVGIGAVAAALVFIGLIL